MRYLYQKKQITKSVYFDFLKSKGAVKYADVIVQKFTPDGIKILILNRCTDMGEATDDWCIPGGHVDEGEEFKVAARRELWEETGIEVAADRLREVATYKTTMRTFTIIWSLLTKRKVQASYLTAKRKLVLHG